MGFFAALQHRTHIPRPWIEVPQKPRTHPARHTQISNRIAFDWGRDPVGNRGAERCLRHLRRWARGRPFVVLALDGENWMRVRGFLHHLYGGLEGAGDLETVTLHDLLQEFEARRLDSFPEGSWGRHNDLSTWVGSPAKDRLWAEIEGTRRMLLEAPGGAPEEAWRWLYAAEGSDYTYWDTTGEGPFIQLARAFLRRARELAEMRGASPAPTASPHGAVPGPHQAPWRPGA